MEPAIVQMLVTNIINVRNWWLAGVSGQAEFTTLYRSRNSDNVGDSEPARLGQDAYAPAQHIELRVAELLGSSASESFIRDDRVAPTVPARFE
jgi:hypothetical protein